MYGRFGPDGEDLAPDDEDFDGDPDDFQYTGGFSVIDKDDPFHDPRIVAQRRQLLEGAERGDFDTIREILDNSTPRERHHLLDKDPGWPGNFPLLAAALSEHANDLRISRCLLDRGAAVNQTNLNGATALWSASYTGNTRVASLLIRRGADLVCHHFDYLGGVSGAPVMTSTMMIARSMNRSDSPIVALLESVTRPPRKRMQAHWLRRILFHVVGRRSEKHWLRRILDHVVSRRRTNPASARHQLAADRFLPERIAAFMLPPEE